MCICQTLSGFEAGNAETLRAVTSWATEEVPHNLAVVKCFVRGTAGDLCTFENVGAHAQRISGRHNPTNHRLPFEHVRLIYPTLSSFVSVWTKSRCKGWLIVMQSNDLHHRPGCSEALFSDHRLRSAHNMHCFSWISPRKHDVQATVDS